MISCIQFEGFILDYLAGELPRRQRLIFDMHLAVCRECRDYLAAYRAAMTVTKSALAEQEMHELEQVPEDLITAVLAARTS
jgi:anti-sigma factor RsiW